MPADRLGNETVRRYNNNTNSYAVEALLRDKLSTENSIFIYFSQLSQVHVSTATHLCSYILLLVKWRDFLVGHDLDFNNHDNDNNKDGYR